MRKKWLNTTDLEYVGSSTFYNSIGLGGLLQRELYFFKIYVCGTEVFKNDKLRDMDNTV
jgi:hypothetical protein